MGFEDLNKLPSEKHNPALDNTSYSTFPDLGDAPKSFGTALPDTGSIRRDVGAEEFESYMDADIHMTQTTEPHWNEMRAQDQGYLELFYKGIHNTVVEVGIGTLEGASYLLDFEQHLNTLQGTEKEFGNWFGDLMKGAKSDLSATVYQTKESLAGWAPTDASWWATHAPSIGSAVSLLIPGMVAIKGLSAGARAMGLASKMKALGMAPTLVKGVTGAIVSRYMENTMEASQTFEKLKQDALNKGLSEENAIKVASTGAASTYYANWANLAWDIAQYSTIFGGFTKGKLWKNLAKGAVTEGAEEGEQFVVQQESERFAKQSYGLDEKDNTTFTERLKDYVQDPEFKTSVLFGALGGMLFAGVGEVKKHKEQRRKDRQIGSFNTKAEQFKAAVENDEDGYTKGADNAFVASAFKHADGNTFSVFREDMQEMMHTPKDILEQSPHYDSKDFHVKLAGRLQDLDFAENQHGIIKKESLPDEIKGYKLGLVMGQRFAERRIGKLNNDVAGILAEDTRNNNFDTRLIELKRLYAIVTTTKGKEAFKDEHIAAKLEISDLQKAIKEDKSNSLNSIEAIKEHLSTSMDSSLASKMEKFFTEREELNDIREKIKLTGDVKYQEQFFKEQADKKEADVKAETKETDKKAEDVKTAATEERKATDKTVVEEAKAEAVTATPEEREANPYFDLVDQAQTQEDINKIVTQAMKDGSMMTAKLDAYAQYAHEALADDSTSIEELLAGFSKNKPQSIIPQNDINDAIKATPVTEAVDVPNNASINRDPITNALVDKGLTPNDELLSGWEGDTRSSTNEFQFEYTIVKGKREYKKDGKLSVMQYDATGKPVTTGQETEINFEFKDRPDTLAPGTKLRLSAWLDSKYMQEMVKANPAILDNPESWKGLHIKIEAQDAKGQWTIVGQLRDHRENETTKDAANESLGQGNNALAILRQHIFNNYKANNEFFETVKTKTVGFPFIEKTRDAKNDLVTVHSPAHLLFGITKPKYAIGDSNSTVIDNAGKVYGQGTKGAVYAIIPHVSGPVPVRLHVRTLTISEIELIIGSLKKMTEDNYKDTIDTIRETMWNGKNSRIYITSDSITYREGTKKTTVKLKDLSDERLINILNKQFLRIDQSLLNNEVPIKGFANYNTYLESVNALTTELNTTRPFYGSIIVMEPAVGTREVVKDQTEPKVKKKQKPSQDYEGPVFREFNKVSAGFTAIEEEAFIRRRLPLAVHDLEMLKRIKYLGSDVQGAFYNAAIYLYKNAAKGTGYHEAFHAVYRLYLTDKQRDEVYQEAKKRFGIPSTSILASLVSVYPNASDEQIVALFYEEKMADEFMNYVISNGEKKVRGKIGVFFKQLLDFIRSIFGKKLTLNELFDNINTGVYQDANIVRNTDKFKSDVAYRVIDGFTPMEQRRRVNSITFRVFTALKKMREEGKIKEYTDITSDELKGIFEDIRSGFQDTIDEYEGQEALSKVLHRWDDFVKKSLESFERLGYEVSDEAEDFIITDSQESEETKERIYSKDFFTENLKKSLAKEIRLFLNFIPKTDRNGQPVRDDLGEFTFIEGNELYAYIAKNVTNLDSLDEMVAELKELTPIKPELVWVTNHLENPSADTYFKNKFFTTFSNQQLNFVTITNKGFEGDRTFEVFETNRRSLGKRIISEWKANYLSDKNDVVDFDSKTGNLKVDLVKARKLKGEYISVVKGVENNKLTDEQAQVISTILNKIGITLNPLAFKAAIENANDVSLYLTGSRSIASILNTLAEGGDVFSSNTEKRGELNAINLLSKIELTARVDETVESFLNGENNIVFSINRNTGLSKAFRPLLSSATSVEAINELFKDAFYNPEPKGLYANSWLKTLRDNSEAREGAKIYIFDTERFASRGSQGTPFNNINDFLWERAKINLLLNQGNKFGYFSSPTPADKPNTFFVRFLKHQVEVGVDGKLKGRSYDELFKMFMQEAASIKQAKHEIATLPADELIEGFHTNVEGMAKKGTKFQIFKGFNEAAGQRAWDADSMPDIFVADDIRNIRAELLDWFNREYNQELENLIDLDIIQRTEDGKLLNKEIDSRVLSSEEFNNDLTKVVKAYVLNTLIGYNGITAVTSGNPAFYKSEDDVTKRYALWQTPGTDVGKDGYANIAIASDIKGISDEVSASIRKALSTLGLRKDAIDKIINEYRKTTATDAQGLTTLARYIDIRKRQGEWSKKEDSALEDLLAGKPTAKSINLLISPVKGTYIGQRKLSNGRIVPVVIKYSTIPLIPAVTRAFPVLENLRTHLENNSIDELVFKSGWKVGAQAVGDINDLSTLKSLKVGNDIYRIPLVNPYKEKYPIFATQIRWHILSNIDETTSYSIGDDTLSGKEVIEHFNKLITDNLKEDHFKTVNRLKLQNFEKIAKQNEVIGNPLATHDEVATAKAEVVALRRETNEALREILIDEVKKRGNLPESYEKALDINDEGYFNIPLDFPVFSRKYENMLFSVFKNKVIKQTLPGMTGINVSEYGYTEENGDTLKYFTPEYDEENNITVIRHCEIYVSQDYFKNTLGREITSEEFKSWPESAKKGIAYRIPNQGKNFMIHFTIKDILPKEAAQQIIAPRELVTQVGLDFDIDKMFLILPHLEVAEDKINVVKYTDGLSRKQRDNRLLDIFMGVLSNPAHYTELTTPNSTETLKEVQKTIQRAAGKATLGKSWYSLKYQRDSRRLNQAGKQLVGVYSNHAVGYIKMQLIKPESYGISFLFNNEAYTSIQDVDSKGIKITDTNAESQSAAVDNAKDPILGDLNDSTYIAPVRAMMNAYGVDAETAGLFLRQPILVEFSKLYALSGSTNQAAKNAIEKLVVKYTGLANTGQVGLAQHQFWLRNDLMLKCLESLGKPLSADIGMSKALIDTPDVFAVSSESKEAAIKIMVDGFNTVGKEVYKIYAKQYHPDTENGDTELMQVINNMNDEYKKYGSVNIVNYIQDKVLLASINTDKYYKFDPYVYQLKVLDSFIKYKRYATHYNDVVSTLASDSLVSGLSSTVSENSAWISKNDKLMSDIGSIIKENKGFGIHLAPAISKLEMTQAFTEYGIKSPTSLLSNIFAWGTPMFVEVRGYIEKNLGINLNPQLMEEINYNMFNFLFTNSTSPLAMSAEEKTAMLFGDNSLSKHISAFKLVDKKGLIKDNNYEVNKFLDNLYIEKGDKMDTIKFNNTNGSFTQDQKTELSDYWLKLFNDETTSKLAIDLLTYSILSHGFVKGPSSFIDLAPVEIWNSMGVDTWYNKLRSEFSNPGYVDPYLFMDQYLRNHAFNDLLVPKIKATKGVIDEMGVSAINADQIKVDLTENSRFLAYKEGYDQYFKPFIKVFIRNSNTTELYKFTGWIGDKVSGQGLYSRVEVLGNSAITEYAIEEAFPSSVLPENKFDKFSPLEDPTIKAEDFFGSGETSQEFFELAYDRSEIEAKLRASEGIQYTKKGEYRVIGKFEKYKEAITTLAGINKVHPDAVRMVKRTDGKTYVVINDRPELFQLDTEKHQRDESLDMLLKQRLASLGVKVTSVNEIRTRTGKKAVAVANLTKKVIQVAKGLAGRNTLPEESGHFFVAALGEENPIYKALYEDVVHTEVYKQVKIEYSEEYEGNEAKIRFEAIGKLLGQTIVEKHIEASKPFHKRIVARLKAFIDRVLQLFKKGSIDTINKDVQDIYGDLAKDILADDFSAFDADKIGKGEFYQLGDKLTTIKAIVEHKIAALKARAVKYKASGKPEYAQIVDDVIKALNALEGEAQFEALLKRAVFDLDGIKLRLDEDRLDVSGVQRATEIVSAYAHIDKFHEDISPELAKLATEVETLRQKLEARLNETQRAILSVVMKNVTTNPGKHFLNILEAHKDISGDQRYLGAIASSDDTLLGLTDKVYKRTVDKANENSREFIDKHSKLVFDVQKAEKNFEFMLQRSTTGMPTGNIVTKYGAEYHEAMARALVFKNVAGVPEADHIRKERINNFFKSYHKQRGSFGERTEPKDIYIDPKWARIQSNPTLKAYYDFYNEAINKTDEQIPVSYRRINKIFPNRNQGLPVYKKTFIEDINRNGLKLALKGLSKSYSESWDYIPESKHVVTDESGKVVSFLKVSGGSKVQPERMSFDVPRVLNAYVHMGNMYEAKSGIRDLMDLIKDVISKRKIPIMDSSGNQKVDSVGNFLFKEGTDSNVVKRFEDWYNMVYLDNPSKDTGSFNILGKQIGKQRISAALLSYSSLKALALNAFAGVNNITLGNITNMIEAAGGEFYTIADYLWAGKEYGKEMGTYFGKDSKLKAMIEYFDVMQDTKELEGGESVVSDKAKMIYDLPFIFNKAGEHFLQTRMFLAMSRNRKVKGKDGKTASLWDAYEVVDGILTLKDNFKTSDISNFATRSDFRQQVKGINQKLHGRYTAEEAAAVQQYALGKLAMQFRKWMHAGYEARFRKQYYDERLMADVKGRWRSYGDFSKMLFKHKGNFIAGWSTMNSLDRANMRRNTAELAYLAAVITLLTILSSLGDDDDDLKKNKMFNFMNYQADRLVSETLFYVSPADFMKILRSPAASLSTIENLIKVFVELGRFPFVDEEKLVYQRGQFKGEYKLEKMTEDLIPIWKEANRWISIEDGTQHYKK